MRVSVIIPCFRHAHYLPGAIDSALAQTYPDVEVIVVDDGSDDNTAEVAAGYAPRVRYVHRENCWLDESR
jgi:glycosyltransferase involved in cell wall biosynthesis